MDFSFENKLLNESVFETASYKKVRARYPTPITANINKSPPAIFKSAGSSATSNPRTLLYKFIFPIDKIPFPKAYDGINLIAQVISTATSLVDGMILRTKVTNGPTPPNKKWMKNVATYALP